MVMAPISSLSLSMGTAMCVRAPASLADGLGTGSAAASMVWMTLFDFQTRSRALPASGRNRPRCPKNSANAGGALSIAAIRAALPSYSTRLPNLAWQIRTAFASTASNTGSSLPGELEMMRSTSEVAVCCSSASASSRVRASSCSFNSISVGPLLTRTLAFVPVERSLRPRVGLFAPLRDKVTSLAQPLVPPPVGPAKDRACQSYAFSHSITSSPLFAERNIMEDLPGLPDQSALTPANFTTLADFSVSSTRSLPKSADEPGRAVAPNSANRAFILGSARAALISLLSLSTISAGVLFGAPTPVQKLDSYPGTNSATVGMSGNTGERVAVVTASARSLPLLTYSIDEDMVANMTCTCPPSRSTSAGPAPRYGTCTRLTPVIILNSSPKIWFPEPMPPDAMLILPELTLA